MSYLLHVFPPINLHELAPITDAYQWNAHDHLEETYIFVPNCLFNEVCSAKTFDLSVENTSDHLPIMIKLNQPKIPDCVKILNGE